MASGRREEGAAAGQPQRGDCRLHRGAQPFLLAAVLDQPAVRATAATRSRPAGPVQAG